MAANHPTILSREEARALGLKRFFTGEPCSKQTHIAERFVCNGMCLKCCSDRAANLKKVRERDREHARKYRARNPKRFKENVRKWRAANWQWILEYQRRWRAEQQAAKRDANKDRFSKRLARGQAQQAASPAARGDRQRGRHDRRMVMEST